MNSRYLAASLAKDFDSFQLSSFLRFYSDEGFTYRDVLDMAGRPNPDARASPPTSPR